MDHRMGAIFAARGLSGPFDQNSVAVLANVWLTGQFDQKGCDHLWPF